METKRWWQSRTIWKSFITIFIGALAAAGINLDISAEQQVQLLGSIMIVVGALAAYLRTDSKKMITRKPDD